MNWGKWLPAIASLARAIRQNVKQKAVFRGDGRLGKRQIKTLLQHVKKRRQ